MTITVGSGFCSLAFLALLVLSRRLVEERLAVALDSLLVFLADLGWIRDPVFLVIALDKLLGRLRGLV